MSLLSLKPMLTVIGASYNSVVFSTLSTTGYTVLNVDESRISSDPDVRDFRNAREILQAAATGNFDNLTLSQCIDKYSTSFLTDRSDVVLVSSLSPEHQSHLGYEERSWIISNGAESFEWMCRNGIKSPGKPCKPHIAGIKQDPGGWKPYGFPIRYCLSRPVQQYCRLNFHTTIAIAVLVSNSIKIGIIAYAAFQATDDPLFVLGDAIQSFLACPDPHSKGKCLLSKTCIRQSARDQDPSGAQDHAKHTHRWIVSLSLGRRITSIVM